MADPFLFRGPINPMSILLHAGWTGAPMNTPEIEIIPHFSAMKPLECTSRLVGQMFPDTIHDNMIIVTIFIPI